MAPLPKMTSMPSLLTAQLISSPHSPESKTVTSSGASVVSGTVSVGSVASVAWVASVAFAYVTNKLFVFESKSWKGSVLKTEIPSFVGARVFSLGVESLGLLVFVKWLGFDRFTLNLPFGFSVGGKLLVKIGLAVIVVVMNYVFSKFIIFKKDEKKE